MPIGSRGGRGGGGGDGGRPVGTLLSPALNANKVEEGVTTGGTRPDGINRADAFQADEAGDEGTAPGGGGEESSDLGKVRRIPTGYLEVGGEDRILESGAADSSAIASAIAAAGVRFGENRVGCGT